MESLEQVAQKYGFRNTIGVEKYIMNFEIFFHMSKTLPNCILKGGMAVPFYVDHDLRRLSEDIDIITSSSKDDTAMAVQKVSGDLAGLVEIREYRPKTPSKTLPMLTYICRYGTSQDQNMKVDIFYGDRGDIKTDMMAGESEIVGFKTDFMIQVYDHGSLVADKLTTLAFHTIGIPKSRETDIPKQIHDIASLLKSFKGELQTDIVVDSLVRIIKKEMTYCQEQHSFDSILNDLEDFAGNITDKETKLKPRYNGQFSAFKGQLLTSRYAAIKHEADILLIRVFIKLIVKRINKTHAAEMIDDKMNEILEKSVKIPNKIVDKTLRSELKKKYEKNSDDWNLLNTLPYPKFYLYDCLRGIDSA